MKADKKARTQRKKILGVLNLTPDTNTVLFTLVDWGSPRPTNHSYRKGTGLQHFREGRPPIMNFTGLKEEQQSHTEAGGRSG